MKAPLAECVEGDKPPIEIHCICWWNLAPCCLCGVETPDEGRHNDWECKRPEIRPGDKTVPEYSCGNGFWVNRILGGAAIGVCAWLIWRVFLYLNLGSG